MSDIKWKKKYEIGHSRIDFEHQIFVDLIAKIDDASNAEHENEYLKRLLYELRKYVEFHFISEENIMYSINYPEYEIHRRLHEELIETYNQKSIQIEMGTISIADLLDFLKDWFVSHTLNEDQKISNFIKGDYV